MKNCRVTIHSKRSQGQQDWAKDRKNYVREVFDAVDEDYNILFSSFNLQSVIEFANRIEKVSHISMHLE